MINREDINIFCREDNKGHIFLEINNNEFEVFRSFEDVNKLIEHLKQYPINNIDFLIDDIKLLRGVR